MKVFVEFEALCKEIHLEEFLSGIRFGKDGKTLRTIPYNTNTLGIINDNYKDDQIFVLAKKKEGEKYSQMIIRDLSASFGWNIKFEYYETFEEKVNAVSKDSAFITSNALQTEIYEKTKENSFSGGIVNSFFFSIFAPNRKENRDHLFEGLILIPLEFLEILLPLSFLWPVLISEHSSINKERIIITVAAAMFSYSSAALFREIFEIPSERYHYLNGFEPISSKNFLKHGYSIKAALVYAFCFAFLVFFMTYKDPLAGLTGIVSGFFFFSTYLVKHIIRVPFMVFVSIITTLFISQTSFLRYLLGI